MKPIQSIIWIIVALTLCGFSTQPAEERSAQATLPTSRDPLWEQFAKTKIEVDEKKDDYKVIYPEAVKSMAGKEITITGFMLPLEPRERFTHFLLSKRTPTCPFCPPGEPYEIIEVNTIKPTTWEDGAIKITGIFGLAENKELGLIFKLKDGKVVK